MFGNFPKYEEEPLVSASDYGSICAIFGKGQ